MRKQIAIKILIMVVALQSFAGGDLVNNGAGIAEKNILFAYRNLSKYIGLCLRLEGCKLNTSQKKTLEAILAGLPQEQKSEKQIQFASEKKTPGFFVIDGEVKIAKTGSAVGSPIYVNSDLLYSRNETGTFIPLSLIEAVALLIHELGHHYGNESHSELDVIGIKVSMLLNQKVYTSPFLPWSHDIQLTVVNYDQTNSFPDVLLSSGQDVVDLTRLYKEKARCPIITIPLPVIPIPDIDVISKDPKSSVLHNLHWTKMKEQKDLVKLTISGNMSHQCESDNLLYLNNDFIFTLEFTLNKTKKGSWAISTDGLHVTQRKQPWWKIIRLPLWGD